MRNWLLRILAICSLTLLAGTSAAGPCDLLGGDADGDGICDDGSSSGFVGDLPCSCQPGGLPACAAGCDDNCIWAANPDQSDVGRVGSPGTPDGIGDACQCLDVSDNGQGDLIDAILYRRFLNSLPPGLAAPEKCPFVGPSACDATDVDLLRDVMADLIPPPPNFCQAAGTCTMDADCPAGAECNLETQVCGLPQGQTCLSGNQCSSGACCSDMCIDPGLPSNSPPGEDLGQFLADARAGDECDISPCSPVATRTGQNSRFFTVTALEGPDQCDAVVGMRIDLEVGLDLDFDIYVTGACMCWPDSCSSENGAGQTDSIMIWCEDNPNLDDSFTAEIEVRYFAGGEFCQDWTLTAHSGNCIVP